MTSSTSSSPRRPPTGRPAMTTSVYLFRRMAALFTYLTTKLSCSRLWGRAARPALLRTPAQRERLDRQRTLAHLDQLVRQDRLALRGQLVASGQLGLREVQAARVWLEQQDQLAPLDLQAAQEARASKAIPAIRGPQGRRAAKVSKVTPETLVLPDCRDHREMWEQPVPPASKVPRAR